MTSTAQARINNVAGHVGGGEFFHFTLDDTILSVQQRRQYERDGFIVVRNLIPTEDIDTYNRRFQEVCAMEPNDIKKLNFLVMRDVAIAKSEFRANESAITKLQDWQDDPVLFQFCKHPNVIQYVKGFCGPNVKSIHTMLINKPPDQGAGTSRHPMHQDLHYFPLRPENRIVCAWTAMEHIHTGNGCLTVVPGSHRQYPLLKHDYPEWEGGVNKMYHGVKVDPKVIEQRIHLEMQKGDVVFFHPLLLHGSGMNRTQGFRKAISCHYASADCYLINIQGTTQEFIAEEIAEIVQHKLKSKKPSSYAIVDSLEDNLTTERKCQIFCMVWQAKSRLICGKPGNF